jgi:phosphatidylserine/phosphatidylglycerophosphate/cardiolipin synthase-like enzyme
MGSANWTRRSASDHLEMGMWTTNPGMVEAALEFVAGVVMESLPLGAERPAAPPGFRPAEWDDQAFREYFAEHVADPPDDDLPDDYVPED